MPDQVGHDEKDFPTSLEMTRKIPRTEPWNDGKKGGLPPQYKGGKARFPGLFVATLPPQQEGGHACTVGKGTDSTDGAVE